MRIALIFSVFFLSIFCSNIQASISIIADEVYFKNSITAITISDVKRLLESVSQTIVTYNDTLAERTIYLPKPFTLDTTLKSFAPNGANYHYFSYPIHSYSWDIQKDGKFKLRTTSFQGISFGLYGLLQEKLGFSFYHSREIYIPPKIDWTTNKDYTWESKPIFDKKGFHLHTQHPIELTEPLLDQDFPNALHTVKEYINWLVRNGQNYFEFCLLENIDRKKWTAHAKEFVEYAHCRGILVGVDFSLHMIQQKTFQMYLAPTQSIQSKEKQMIKNLEWIMQVNWDFLNMEFASAEFIGGNRIKKEALRLKMIEWLKEHKPNTKLMGRQHIVKHENEQAVIGKTFQWDSNSSAIDSQRGVMSHTVMFYDMTEENAPVYQNKNQRHQFEFLKDQMKTRETWYYPESSYWVTFDNSVPMFLLPYLTARLADIDTCEFYQVPGHLTFSSGWEWGYWLIDWSIARWSWNHWEDGKRLEKTPLIYANKLMTDKQSKIDDKNSGLLQDEFANNSNLWMNNELERQQLYLKDKNLIKWMTSMSITDELPTGMNNEFHPRPPFSYKYLQRKANLSEITLVRIEVLPLIDDFANYTLRNIKTEIAENSPMFKLEKEWLDGIKITALRASHRYYTLSYILAKREAKINLRTCNCDSLLEKAITVRQQAQIIVNEREKYYRYPHSSIASQMNGHTSYEFGYLFPVHNLQYWYREEQQAIHNRYGPLYKTIFNPFKIIGLID